MRADDAPCLPACLPACLSELAGWGCPHSLARGRSVRRVFKDLDGVSLAVQKKSKDIAAKYFQGYVADMASLFALLQDADTSAG